MRLSNFLPSRGIIWTGEKNPKFRFGNEIEWGAKMKEKFSENQNFDFDIGYLVKSPCRDCNTRKDLPDCIEGCEILDRIQAILADSIPSEVNFSPAEAYEIPAEILQQI